ncbi:hypothetical protein DFA_12342 [Cavenderia fasciculata]|uniref:Uncharacterized protein n=1 Tax=Cavenderia fasciculata TaxID=261658 RepID=F4QDE7_CACFS|nr:uncharacterized protein DFA_12342 [Cavenderia fasciculata]EGG14565.1 hypothetical protein DFA_12342 [Cavenderia fasciculata]|eukprot:XP_004366085.1 hypothetical protein DFA_12342 [Cavenderia fasciculata]
MPPGMRSQYSATFEKEEMITSYHIGKNIPPEYVHYYPSLDLVQGFFEHASERLISHSYCDMYFRLFLSNTVTIGYCLDHSLVGQNTREFSNAWLYCYRHHTEGVACQASKNDNCNYIMDELLSSFPHIDIFDWSSRLGQLVKEHRTLSKRKSLLAMPQEIFDMLELGFILQNGCNHVKENLLYFFKLENYEIQFNIAFVPSTKTKEEIDQFRQQLDIGYDIGLFHSTNTLPTQEELDTNGCWKSDKLFFIILKSKDEEFYPIDTISNLYTQKITSTQYYYLDNGELMDDYPPRALSDYCIYWDIGYPHRAQSFDESKFDE